MNIWITWMYHKGNLYDPDGMTKNYYRRVVGRWSAPDSLKLLMDPCDFFAGNPSSGHVIYQNDFETASGSLYTDQAITGTKSLLLNKDNQASPIFSIPCESKKVDWIRLQSRFRCKNKEWDVWKMAQFVVRLRDTKQPDKLVQEGLIRVYRQLNDGEVKDISFFVKAGGGYFNQIDVLYWNGGSDHELVIDDLKVSTYSD